MTPQMRTDAPAIYGGVPVLQEPLRFIKPTLPPLQRVLKTYRPVYDSGVITNADLVTRFEAAARERLSAAHCVAVSSCTSGLAMVLRALDLKGEVILPSFTFFATGHAILWNGLTPVFADCDAETWTLDPASVEAGITERTSAIVAVHLYGNPCDVDALERIAAKHRLRLIFDAAHGFGSVYRGRPVGQFGDAEVFSLSPTKLLVAGEGGLVSTSDAALAHRIRAARNYGDLGAYDPELLGFNARMTEFNAALALAGLGMMKAKIGRHNKIADLYTSCLAGVPGLRFQTVCKQDVSTYKDYSVLVDADEFGLSRDRLAEALLAENIVTKKYFSPPLHKQMLYRQFWKSQDGSGWNTDYIADTVLSLPVYESLSDETVEAVGYAIKRIARYFGGQTQTSNGPHAITERPI